ncbi:MAG: hypothetical protein V3V17_06115 [Alphaproteobacteria bacterium]
MRLPAFLAASLVLAAHLALSALAQAAGPEEPPASVLAAEDALALGGVVGMAYVDVRYAVEAERTILGQEDEGALLDPMAVGSILAVLEEHGIRARETVDYVLVGAAGSEQGFAAATIVLGRFAVDDIVALLPEAYGVEPATIDGHEVLILTEQDVRTCEVSDPIAVHLSGERIVAAEPTMIGPVLDRLASGAPAELDLAEWRAYRSGRVMALGLLVPAGEIDATGEGAQGAMMFGGVGDDIAAIERFYFGATLDPDGPRLALDMRIESNDPAWAAETASAIEELQALTAELGEELPTLTRLQGSFSAHVEGTRLVAEVSFTEETLKNIAQIPAELIMLMFAEMGMEADSASLEPSTEEEQTVAPEELPAYYTDLAHDHLEPFNPEHYSDTEWNAQTGPFGVRVSGLNLVTQVEELVAIDIEVSSGKIPNMEIDSMHMIDDDPRAQLFITSVRDANGVELLLEETCGEERNSDPGALQSRGNFLFIDNEFVTVPTVSGTKTVRLAPGSRASDVTHIEGYVRLRLPTAVESHLLTAPFENQIVELDGVRVRFQGSDPDSLVYDISGQTDRVLAVHALNEAKQYLRSKGSYSSGRVLGSGKTIGRGFTGRPAYAQLLIAGKDETKDYPFELGSAVPSFDRWDFPTPYRVGTTSGELFAREAVNAELANPCGADTRALHPFELCPRSLESAWSGMVQGQFDIAAPRSTALEGNFSGLELVIEGVQVETGGAIETMPVEIHEFAELSPFYGAESLQQSLYLYHEDDGRLHNKALVAIEGRLILRLPVRLAQMHLDVTELGNRTEHPNGQSARLVGVSDGALQIEIRAPRESLVQFIPYDAEGNQLATNAAQLEAGESPGLWHGTVRVSGRPQSLDIVFAEEQERIDYPFSLPVGD